MTFDGAQEMAILSTRRLIENRRTLVITGAGISTDSGIPDYRGEGRVQKHPLTFDEFMGSKSNQARYWARSYVGWNRIASANPNLGHQAIADAEKRGVISSVITQNVDGLHQKAGSRSVLELHGRLDRVLCVGCGDSFSRLEMDERIAEANPQLIRDFSVEFSPDGDAEGPHHVLRHCQQIHCLKPSGELTSLSTSL